jgi:hypothetical protein
MKKAILTFALLWATFSAMAQTNKYESKSKPSSDKVAVTDVFTGDYYTDKFGNQWKVYKTASGRFYVHRQSKSGNWYKMYVEEKGGANETR